MRLFEDGGIAAGPAPSGPAGGNVMGNSSSKAGTGPIDTYDPSLRGRLMKRYKSVLGSINVDGHNGSSVGGDGPPAYDEMQGTKDKA
jgi:hypothetical protein